MSDGAFPPVARDDASAAFFDAAARGELLVRRCLDSGDVLGPEARTCTGCGSARLEPFVVSGRGVLVTWAVVHQVPVSALRGAVPYVTAVVELAEGPWLLVRLVGTDGRDLRAGQPVSARFVRPQRPDDGSGAEGGEAPGEVLPVFAPDARLTARG
ncbi:hypothetical protein CcI49_37850 [Frankia sp. CcI49]|uniref:Zn-ribbon domain-containing OB-fold protein n=1 Tax=Frankia sp. CcI49 TaxID=1745382 RepID=UPI000976A562|nr:OB-fold domain-containing protein [Frankia sp. CcI49]ONH49955.1 hypothetical protein CcI49_37850 [Frankia sp. CcI49]